MPTSAGDVLAGRYRLADLLSESRGGQFWRAHDQILARHVAVHVIPSEDPRADRLLAAARRSATVTDRHLLRVLDADEGDGLCYVVNEWGSGISLDNLLSIEGPLEPKRAAWICSEVGIAITAAHAAGVTHGRLVPENVLVDLSGAVRIIGFAVDAALHGLPDGRESADVVDLGALVYAALTGKWAGVSRSVVPAAPDDAGRVLRPRRVRAGIPRALDSLCDRVLNPAEVGAHVRDGHDLKTARGLTASLRDFVGDPAVMAAQEATRPHGRAPAEHAEQVAAAPALEDPVEHPPGTVPEGSVDPDDAADPDDSDPDTAAHSGPAAEHSEMPTQAGLPIFDDASEDVSWLSPRDDRPPPPPPFDDLPERPLFAPDSPPGSRLPVSSAAPVPVPGSPAPAEYWPFDSTGGGSLPGVRTGEQDPVPGRSWLRLAMLIAAVVALVVALAFAYQLGLGSSRTDPEEPGNGNGNGGPVPAEAFEVAGIIDLDPQGTPPEENRDLVGLAIDGDPETAWRTKVYFQNFGPGGLKSGLGLVLDLGESRLIGSVDVLFRGSPTEFEIHVGDQEPADLDDLTLVAEETAAGVEHTVTFEDRVEGRYLLIWLTSLPSVDGGFRAEIADVVVHP
ncbi:protein kinase family protein [Nocardioides limicola]|uniref:protein kinase family protein n=1 Tax=Nocardioides limicola TaxID=2803368 RepID=UPI00193BD43C|nr:protein kinase family protein [Nocardioides sp. DJM-14]